MDMAVSLSKGQKVDLTKNNPGLKKIILANKILDKLLMSMFV